METRDGKERPLIQGEFVDLNKFRGLGESPVYHPPTLLDGRPRLWPLSEWSKVPRDLGYDDFPSTAWKGLRLLKDPSTQALYHNILWDLRPKTIIELGVYGGGSLLWFRDLTKVFFRDPCEIIGIDLDPSRSQIPEDEMEHITLRRGDCNEPDSVFSSLKKILHPVLLIDDAHANTFNVLKWAINHDVLLPGDVVVIEDTMGLWKRYSPNILASHLSAFGGVLALDLLYSNVPSQLQDGVFRVIQ